MRIIQVFKDESYTGGEIVSLAEAKASLLVDYADDDALITSMITKARNAVEEYCHISLVPKSITLTLGFTRPEYNGPSWINRWDRQFFGYGAADAAWIELPYGPVSSIASVTAMSDDGQYVSLLQPPTLGSIGAQPGYFVQGVVPGQASFVRVRPVQYSDQLMIVYNACWVKPPEGVRQCILTEVNNLYFQRGNPQADLSEKTKVQCEPFIHQWQ